MADPGCTGATFETECGTGNIIVPPGMGAATVLRMNGLDVGGGVLVYGGV